MTATRSVSRRRLRRFCIGATLAGAIGVIGASIAGCSRGISNQYHGWHCGHGFHEVDSPEEAQERARTAAKWMLRKIDATDDQQQRIQAIVDESVQQLYPLREKHRLHHAQLLDAMSRPTVDRAEIERLRKAEIEIADAASDWMVDAALDMFEVLTPEQRTEMLDHMRERHM